MKANGRDGKTGSTPGVVFLTVILTLLPKKPLHQGNTLKLNKRPPHLTQERRKFFTGGPP
ncbi:MAG: hypothetical protein B6240_13805 [Desulfobacteraceae bacterium 4572_87]|nr:MAG: hypothetical protein B6240_13805 [Desulfobacteraceae bacterium 4572_87]